MDIVDLNTFYQSPLGTMTADVVAHALRPIVQPARDHAVMGLGFAPPYLERLVNPEIRQMAFMPAKQGVHHWPQTGKVAAALVDEYDLPLLESTIDVAIVVHALELADTPLELLKELWRVMAPQGKIYIVVANRRGLWSGSEHSPFGFGQPFSRRQLSGLLKEAQFSVMQWRPALFAPPIAWTPLLKSASVIEKIGQYTTKGVSGVLIVEAIKQVYAFSSGKRAKRFVPKLRPALLPQPHRHIKTRFAFPDPSPYED